MTRGVESEQPERLGHARSVDAEKVVASAAFITVMDDLLKAAPNAKGDQSGYKIGTANDYGYPPTDKASTFGYKNSNIHASFYVDWGMPPMHTLTITTAIIVDNLPPQDPWDSIHGPVEPREIVTVKASPYYGDLDVSVKAVTRLGNHGNEVTLDQYTAGGLLLPIATEGAGKVRTVNEIVALFKDYVPAKPIYKLPPPVRGRVKA